MLDGESRLAADSRKPDAYCHGDADIPRNDHRTVTEDQCWWPPVLSCYGLTESVHLSQRLRADTESPTGRWAAASWLRPRPPAEPDSYGHENADAACLNRKPVSFAVFGKPGLQYDALAAALSAHWGCVHVSAAGGLAAGLGHEQKTAELRRGRAVNAVAGTAAHLTVLLGLETPDVRERGYVLTGLPRHDSEMSAFAQMDAVFSSNPPDVLIYMSCPNRDLPDYQDGLVLESIEHVCLTQTLYVQNDDEQMLKKDRYIRWNELPGRKMASEYDLADYNEHSLPVIEEIVKRFDPAFVITVDGRMPAEELFAIVKAKLTSMPLHYTPSPKIVSKPDASLFGDHISAAGFRSEMGSEIELLNESSEIETTMESWVNYEPNGEEHMSWESAAANERENERIRSMSEFGRLCPVNYSRGLFKTGNDRYRVEFMGKWYIFAGFDEMMLFEKCPKQYLKIPKPGLPAKVIFCGSDKRIDTVATAVGHVFNYNVIDYEYATGTYVADEKRAYASTIVDSALKTARDIAALILMKANQSRIDEMMTETEIDEEFDYEEELTSLMNYFKSNGAYDESLLMKYLQRTSSTIKSIFTFHFSKQKKIQLELIDFIVDEIRLRNNKNKNWVVVNVPMDILPVLVKKLAAENLNPLQIVFFRNTDPMHRVSMNDEISYDQSKLIKRALKDMKKRLRYGTTVDRKSYPEFVEKTKLASSNIYTEEYESDMDTDDISFNRSMEINDPETTEQLDEYVDDLFEQWLTLKKQISKEMNDLFIEFNVIKCKPDSTEHQLTHLIEDTVHSIIKLSSDKVYDVSTTDDDDTTPTVGQHDGDTSIYCPVSFANGKSAIGSKKHMVVYKNRYYYMSSAKDLRAFVLNPDKYSLFTQCPKQYPKPKISLLHPFGYDVNHLVKHWSDAFDLTHVDANKVFVRNVLSENMPVMVGKMYEQPALKEIVDKYLLSERELEAAADSLRNYMDKESVYLSDENWMKMNSVFFETHGGICYENYPNSRTELEYLKAIGKSPDAVIEVVVADGEEARERAKNAAAKNWLAYQYALIDRVVELESRTRKSDMDMRRETFRDQLAAARERTKTDLVRRRLKNLLETIVAETAAATDGRDAITHVACDQQTRRGQPTYSPDDVLLSRYGELTPKQKRTIVEYGLDKSDLYGLEDFGTLDRIAAGTTETDGWSPAAFLMAQCFSDELEAQPSDASVERHLDAERRATADMRAYAESSGIPWITVFGDTPPAFATAAVAEPLTMAGYGASFETTYDVDLDAAEEMLRTGRAYLSGFGRRCPVTAGERGAECRVPRAFYAPDDRADVRPVVHRKYVYYVLGDERRDTFVERPLAYTALGPAAPPPPPDDDPPLRIAVLGPPKSGKSRCARELCARHGFQLIRVEELVDPGLLPATMRWTGDRASALRVLRLGGALSDAHVAEAVLAATRTARALVRGYVLDGFPATRAQFELLAASGVALHRVFVLDGERCSANGSGHADRGALPGALMRDRRRAWDAGFAGTDWIAEQFGNVEAIAGGDSDRQTDASLAALVRSLRAYRTAARLDRPRALADVPVTGLERRQRASTHQYLCPVCHADDGRMNRPRDAKHLRRQSVQYRAYFYWTCGPEHFTAFSANPERYERSAPQVPELFPEATTVEELSLKPHTRCRHFSEYCVVCALACLWRPVHRRGRNAFAAIYSKHTFAFCSSACRAEFMRRPFFYARYRMHARGPPPGGAERRPGPWPRIDGLPGLGYMEQSVAELVDRALIDLEAFRPAHPGLSPEVTASVFVGLHVGRYGADDQVNEYYREAYNRFVDTCRRFKMDVFELRSIM